MCLCEGVGSPGTGVTHRYKPPCQCWDLNPGPLEKQPVLFSKSLVSTLRAPEQESEGLINIELINIGLINIE